ncbi:hypothetical protein VP01_51g1 [Puccinia sorghi]|uniref:Uncharacterized protein n=1 Tax=Puccinia sorghi TaxID=27349 RepID=A0A0L6UKN4_9BASI|nr:hypothetical protein VP01_51g1 [Puccinia sorghi]
MHVKNLVDPLDGIGVNLKTVILHIHRLSVYKLQKKKQIKNLNTASPLLLQNCSVRDKRPQNIEFLKLHEVTEILCRSNHPTHNFVIPIYMSLIKNIIKKNQLHSAPCTTKLFGLLASKQHSGAQTKSRSKLLEKRQCTVTENKGTHKSNFDMLRKTMNLSLTTLTLIFLNVELWIDSICKQGSMKKRPIITQKPPSSRENHDNWDLDAKIHQYLGKTNEASSMEMLNASLKFQLPVLHPNGFSLHATPLLERMRPIDFFFFFCLIFYSLSSIKFPRWLTQYQFLLQVSLNTKTLGTITTWQPHDDIIKPTLICQIIIRKENKWEWLIQTVLNLRGSVTFSFMTTDGGEEVMGKGEDDSVSELKTILVKLISWVLKNSGEEKKLSEPQMCWWPQH